MSAVSKVILTAQDLTGPAFKSAQSGLEGFSRSAAMAQTALAGLGVGLSVGAVAGYVRSVAQAGAEMDKLAKVANTNIEQFQAQAYAAQKAGISHDQFGSILKDVQDRVGEFLQTGGGPMKDFFEEIAPKVGVTAQQFRNLSGADALQLYVSSLQKANLTQAEMTFYMEAMASDSTLLLPLLKNNGQEMKKMAQEAEALGLVMDEKAVEASKKFNAELTQLGAVASGFGRSVAMPVIQGLNDIIERFRMADRHGVSWLTKLFPGTADVNSTIANAEKQITALEKIFGSRGATTEQRSRAQAMLDDERKNLAFLQEYRRSITTPNATYSPDDQRAAEARRLGLAPPTPIPQKTKAELDADKAKATAAEKALKDREKREKDYQDMLTNYELAQGEWVWNQKEKRRQEDAEQAKQYQDMLADYDLAQSEWVWDQKEKRRMEEEKLQQEANERLLRDQQKLADNMGAAFAQTFDRMFTDGMKFGDLLKKLAFDAINIAFLTPATQKLGSGLASAATALFSSFDGGGYTGTGARSGGLDGKGGFMAVLHPNETVVDHTRGQGVGGSTVVQNISIDARGADAGVEQRIRAAMAQTKADTLAAVQARANRGGSFAAALGRA